MGLFNSGAGQHSLQSLTSDGSIAAVYPSEEQLWLYGPSITDPGDQGYEFGDGIERSGGLGAAAQGSYPVNPVPRNQAEVNATEDWLHEVINGPTPNGAYGEEWVNLDVGGPAGFGNWNEQPYMTGHSQIVVSNPGAEQGWGVGPARRWAHYPFSELGNPVRNAGNHLRMGQLPWAFSEQSMLYYRTQLVWEQQWAPYKQRNPVNPVVSVAPSVPFVQTVPTYGGGFVEYPGLDVPLTDTGSGIY
jgi:hypothetical protein